MSHIYFFHLVLGICVVSQAHGHGKKFTNHCKVCEAICKNHEYHTCKIWRDS